MDYALLGGDGRLLGNPYHYRDRRTDGAMELAFERVPRSALYAATGIQPMQINTLFQLLSMVRAGDRQLETAVTLSPMPNLFAYRLSGRRAAEYTHATTTQCLDARERRWAVGLIESLGIPAAIFPPLIRAGFGHGAAAR